MTENFRISGIVKCLGWCNKTFLSEDRIKIRFCKRCRSKRNHMSDAISRLEEKRLLMNIRPDVFNKDY